MGTFNSSFDVTIWSDDGQTAVTVNDLTTSAKGLNTLPLGKYVSSAPTLLNNEVYPFRLTSDGKLMVDATVTAAAAQQIQVRSNVGTSTDVGYRQLTVDLSLPTVERFQAIQTTITYVGSNISQTVDTDAWGRTLTTTMTYTGGKLTSVSQVLT